MMEQPRREPLQFEDICGGNFSDSMQEKFLKAFADASNFNQKMTVTGKIHVYPPDPNQPSYSNISFEVKATSPEVKSIKYITKLDGGFPVAEAKNHDMINQTSLFEQRPEVFDAEPEHKPEIGDVDND